MAQTATLSNEQSLYIIHNGSVTLSSVARKNIVSEEVAIFQEVDARNNGTHAQLRYEVAPGFAQYFALIRGLIDFNRSKDISFSFDRESASFQAETENANLPELQALLTLVNSLLVREIQFKRKLKEVIRFEEQYKIEKAKVYASFF